MARAFPQIGEPAADLALTVSLELLGPGWKSHGNVYGPTWCRIAFRSTESDSCLKFLSLSCCISRVSESTRCATRHDAVLSKPIALTREAKSRARLPSKTCRPPKR